MTHVCMMNVGSTRLQFKSMNGAYLWLTYVFIHWYSVGEDCFPRKLILFNTYNIYNPWHNSRMCKDQRNTFKKIQRNWKLRKYKIGEKSIDCTILKYLNISLLWKCMLHHGWIFDNPSTSHKQRRCFHICKSNALLFKILFSFPTN